MYRFHQVLNATLSPMKAFEEHEPSPAMLGGIWMEAVVAERLGFTPWLLDGLTLTDAERQQYDIPAQRVVEALQEERFTGLLYQPELFWPEPTTEAQACGHPDFVVWDDDHIVDLKTTEFPTEELLDKYLHSVQMVAYMAAYKRNIHNIPKLTIVLASRMAEPEPVKFNKDGSVSLTGQKCEYAKLKEAVDLMGEKANERHYAMVYKAPVWNPILVKTIEKEQCEQLAKVGEIFLDAGLAILNSGLAEVVVRPYS